MSSTTFLAVVGLMAAIVLFTRVGGAAALAWIPLTPKLERFLEGMSVSVIAALVATMLIRGWTVDMVAVTAACATMAISRSVMGSMLAGMAVAIAYGQVTGG